ncbi:MAG: helix-turn-helix transcriptional regulator [Candidatus Azotimanducaceae bacterium]|uniref:Peptidase S24/S26A/S26B/S26C domain-containing protein n=1 Tax=OM182 bacterium TaxID=2510334 RepID=A0A520S3C9_9GAMM|nr:hypothetical protein [Gammaproteobacteria bacterium]RZO76978.1 MAG: hypothetical protein EVA68_02860 [OM182 bacterium]
MLKLFRTSGSSMLPTIKPRDILLIRSDSEICTGDLVVVNIRAIGLVVKRINQLDGKTLKLIGDNSRLGSSICGVAMDKRCVIGKVIVSLTLPFKLKFFGRGSNIVHN